MTYGDERLGGAYARRLDAVVAGYRGEAAAAEMLLNDDDAGVRSAALGALARCGALDPGQIRRALGDAAAAVRCRAAELAPPEVELVDLLRDPDASVVDAVAAALGERDHDPRPVGELCRVASGHDDPLCRESAIAALGAIAAGVAGGADPSCDAVAVSETGREAHHDAAADPKATAEAPHDAARGMALEVLLAAMDDRPQIRRRALLGLFQFDDERAAAAVQAALEDRDRQVRAVAGELLGVPAR